MMNGYGYDGMMAYSPQLDFVLFLLLIIGLTGVVVVLALRLKDKRRN